MSTTVGEPAYRDRRFPRLVRRVSALGSHRALVTALVVATIAGALVLDVAFPSYPIAGFYLVPVTLAALPCPCARLSPSPDLPRGWPCT